jgi:alkyl hydroperoxide reductase subunit AhpC
MPIQVGDRVPSATFNQLNANGVASIDTATLLKGKKVVLFGLPGAYTTVCPANHLPGFVAKAAELKAKGIDAIACISVNDPFVMQAWGKEQREAWPSASPNFFSASAIVMNRPQTTDARVPVTGITGHGNSDTGDQAIQHRS